MEKKITAFCLVQLSVLIVSEMVVDTDVIGLKVSLNPSHLVEVARLALDILLSLSFENSKYLLCSAAARGGFCVVQKAAARCERSVLEAPGAGTCWWALRQSLL